MERTLETGSLILRPSAPALADKLCDYCVRSREFLREFEPEREEEYFTLPKQRAILEDEVRERCAGTSARFYIFERGGEDIIGSIGLNNIVRASFLSCFIGYKLSAQHINRGYMTQAVNAAVEYAFRELGLHRVEGNVMPRNKASLRVLEKCGFICEGVSGKYLKINGVWEDHVHMVKLNPDME